MHGLKSNFRCEKGQDKTTRQILFRTGICFILYKIFWMTTFGFYSVQFPKDNFHDIISAKFEVTLFVPVSFLLMQLSYALVLLSLAASIKFNNPESYLSRRLPLEISLSVHHRLSFIRPRGTSCIFAFRYLKT